MSRRITAVSIDVRACLRCDSRERRKRQNAVHSRNKALSLFPAVTEKGNDRAMMLRAVRSDAVDPLCTEPDEHPPIGSCSATLAGHLRLKSSGSISGTDERRVRPIAAVRVFRTVVQSNFYQLIV
jgi:hypothetical protein